MQVCSGYEESARGHERKYVDRQFQLRWCGWRKVLNSIRLKSAHSAEEEGDDEASRGINVAESRFQRQGAISTIRQKKKKKKTMCIKEVGTFKYNWKVKEDTDGGPGATFHYQLRNLLVGSTGLRS